MTDDPQVTGGDLYALWQVAHVNLPQVQSAYAEAAAAAHDVDLPDEDKYGRAHPWWAAMFAHYEEALYRTASSVGTAAETASRAVEDFSTLDDGHGGTLSPAGEELADLVKSGPEPVDAPAPLETPNWVPPEGWNANGS